MTMYDIPKTFYLLCSLFFVLYLSFSKLNKFKIYNFLKDIYSEN